MPKYVVILKDKNRGHFTEPLLREHVRHLRELDAAGKLFLCGPFQDNDGAMQILTAGSRPEAEALIQADPFVAARYYASYTIQELIEANEENHFLMKNDGTKGDSK